MDIDSNVTEVPSERLYKVLNRESPEVSKLEQSKREPLTTKKAVEFLLSGTLKRKVCRYCLNIAHPLSELDQILRIAGKHAMYEITIRDIVASFHPFKVVDDENFPDKICEKCLNRSLKSYLFAQQCEQSERALRNCFQDMFEKLEKLDPLEQFKRRGRQKTKVNHNILYTEHCNVIDYAEPIRHMINAGSISYTKEPTMSNLECKKCWQVLPNVESLAYHEKMHPKSMWYSCRLCGQSMPQLYLFRRHLRSHLKQTKGVIEVNENRFECKQCGTFSENYMDHLQHLEKHKFKKVLECVVERKMDKLCAVCLEEGSLTDLDKVICLHGGYPELTGDRPLYSILGSSVPEMNILHNYTGTKVCEKCLSNAIQAYVFINRIRYVRSRLEVCISRMTESLNSTSNIENKLFIEVVDNGIMPILDVEDVNELLLEENEVVENELKVDILEDEFREPDSESDSSDSDETNPNEDVKLNNKPKLLNGYQTYSKVKDVCSEFLTFKKKTKPKKCNKARFTCPKCNKKFISDYFLKKHVIKHRNEKTECKICCNKFRSKFFLSEHNKCTHLLKKSVYYQCNDCGRIFTEKHKFKKHNKLCHRNKTCDLCLKVFANQKYFDIHMQRHANKLNMYNRKRVRNCSFCEQECINENELLVHVNKTHLQIKPYLCDMCDRKFYTERNLSRHKRVHAMFKKQTCEICSKSVKCRRDLVIHIRKHLGIKPSKCPICAESFYSEFNVKNHMKVWHGGCYVCKLCRKVFLNKSGLKNHVNVAHSVF